jgi:hypothetical protein
VAVFTIAQSAVAQTSSPQASPQQSGDVKVVRPQQQAKLEEQQHQRHQPHRQQLQPPQQTLALQQPQSASVVRQQERQQEASLVEQQQSQQQERRHQNQVRRVQRSHAVPESVMSYATALQRCQRERHPHVWWAEHYPVVVFSVGGYYYYDAGYWFPAFGYSPNCEAYDYDGPIYTYGNLLPDQMILNIQRALTDLGYYTGPLSGSLSAATRYAISAYQEDNGLAANGVVDAPLVYSLGLQ